MSILQIRPPEPLPADTDLYPTVFLAGSIDNGAARDWQSEVFEIVHRHYGSEQKIGLFNPRREDWNTNSSEGLITKQIYWELNALEEADAILMCLEPGTQSPISLLEFGLYARSGKMIVCCDLEFWRKTNVYTTASYYGVTAIPDLEIATISVIEKAILAARFRKSQ